MARCMTKMHGKLCLHFVGILLSLRSPQDSVKEVNRMTFSLTQVPIIRDGESTSHIWKQKYFGLNDQRHKMGLERRLAWWQVEEPFNVDPHNGTWCTSWLF